MNKIFFLFTILCLFSCGKKTKNTQNSISYHITVKDEFEALRSDSLFTSVNYVKLETNKESLIHEISKVVMYNNHIFVLDKEQDCVFEFDTNGKFIRKLSEKGTGPNQYIKIGDFLVDNEKIFLLCPIEKKIKVYDLNDNYMFLYSMNTDDTYHQFEKQNEYFYLYSNFNSEELNNITIWNTKNNHIKKIHPFSSKQLGIALNHEVFHRSNDTILCTFPYEYSIFKIKDDVIQEISTIEFEGKMLPKSIRNESIMQINKYIYNTSLSKTNYIRSINNVFVTDTHLIIQINFNNQVRTVVINRMSSSFKSGYLSQTSSFPITRPTFIGFKNGYLIQSVNYEVIIGTEGSPLEKNIPLYIKDGDFDNNPVLAFYRLKDEYCK